MAYGGSKTTPADKDSFLWMIDLLNEWQIDYWVEGGWGIDILLGKQTREHRDIDIDFDASAETELMEKLLELGYQIKLMSAPRGWKCITLNMASSIFIPLTLVRQGK